jgi:uncharacterized ferritin-like protein (DUF455 family)
MRPPCKHRSILCERRTNRVDELAIYHMLKCLILLTKEWLRRAVEDATVQRELMDNLSRVRAKFGDLAVHLHTIAAPTELRESVTQVQEEIERRLRQLRMRF